MVTISERTQLRPDTNITYLVHFSRDVHCTQPLYCNLPCSYNVACPRSAHYPYIVVGHGTMVFGTHTVLVAYIAAVAYTGVFFGLCKVHEPPLQLLA